MIKYEWLPNFLHESVRALTIVIFIFLRKTFSHQIGEAIIHYDDAISMVCGWMN